MPGYVCPPDAGPAWRAAYEAGLDMAALEENLRLTPEERMDKHQRQLDEFFRKREERASKRKMSRRCLPKK